jgi:hydroxymethylbilane synthase
MPNHAAKTLRIATRGSRLARWQAEMVRTMILEQRPELQLELVLVTSTGDVNRTDPLHKIGGMGLFTKEVQDAVLDGRADVAVHSLKDLPTETPSELVLAAVPARGPTEDVLLAPRHQTFVKLPTGAKVATSSLRRRAQLLRRRPDLEIAEVRGNVETRVRKLLDGEFDAMILAAAGLERLELTEHITEWFNPDQMLPAVGQGALGIECRTDDADTRLLLVEIDHAETHRAVAAERMFLKTLQGGCQLPIAALATSSGAHLTLRGNVTSTGGSEQFSGQTEGDDPADVGRRLAEELLGQGARRLLV